MWPRRPHDRTAEARLAAPAARVRARPPSMPRLAPLRRDNGADLIAGAGPGDGRDGEGGRPGGLSAKRGSFLLAYQGALLQGIDAATHIGSTAARVDAERLAGVAAGRVAGAAGGGG